MDHWFDLVARFQVENEAHYNVTNDCHRDVRGRIVSAVVVQCFATLRTVALNSQVALKKAPFSTVGAAAQNAVFHRSPNIPFGFCDSA